MYLSPTGKIISILQVKLLHWTLYHINTGNIILILISRYTQGTHLPTINDTWINHQDIRTTFFIITESYSCKFRTSTVPLVSYQEYVHNELYYVSRCQEITKNETYRWDFFCSPYKVSGNHRDIQWMSLKFPAKV